MQHEHSDPEGTHRLRMVSRLVFFGFVGVAAFFLITEHRAHLFGILPFLLLAACPLMHLFHHGGHGHGGGDGSSKPSSSDAPKDAGGTGHRHG